MGLEKLQRAVLIGDQAQLLQQGAKADKWYQRLRQKIAETEAEEKGVSMPTNGEAAPASDDMELNVDSPTTIHYHVAQQGMSPLAKAAAIAALVASGGGLLGAGAWLSGAFNKAAPAAVSPADSSYDVLFYNSAGEKITVPRVTEAAK